jgi:hypothetical protein
MIRLYVILLDFLIPFLCDPDLQCGGCTQEPHVKVVFVCFTKGPSRNAATVSLILTGVVTLQPEKERG